MTRGKTISCVALLIAMAVAACGYYRIVPRAIDADKLTAQEPAQIRAEAQESGREPAVTPRTILPAPLINTPTKAHLKDGGVVLFPDGFRVSGGLLKGSGEKYDIMRKSSTPIWSVPLREVAALEHYEKDLRPVLSTVTTVPAIIVGTAAAVAISVAVFGSCPTVYSEDEDNGRLLEAELFSHSISRRFEADDLDRLSEVHPRNGGYRLQVANEALETHYLNSLTLETVDHPAGSRAYPTPDGEIVVIEGDTVFTARSSQGEDVTAALTARDNGAYRTDLVLTRALAQNITEDWVELTVRMPAEFRMERPVLTLRLRNTLMATVLFYDVMLKAQGVNALTWLGSDTLNSIYAWRISRWFDRRYSLRVEVWDGQRFVSAGNVSPTGPIAWHDVAVKLPPMQGPEARIRISFLPDNWMVDWASVGSGTAQSPAVSVIAAAGVDGLSIDRAEEVLAPLWEKDSSYLITSPGESHLFFFPAEVPAPGSVRTRFIRSRGFYIEWLREDWFKDAGNVATGPSFEPGDEAVMETARLWLQKKVDLEQRFMETKIPLAGGAR